MSWAYEPADLTILKVLWCLTLLLEPLEHSSKRITEPYGCGVESFFYVRELTNFVRPQAPTVSGVTHHDLGLSDLP